MKALSGKLIWNNSKTSLSSLDKLQPVAIANKVGFIKFHSDLFRSLLERLLELSFPAVVVFEDDSTDPGKRGGTGAAQDVVFATLAVHLQQIDARDAVL